MAPFIKRHSHNGTPELPERPQHAHATAKDRLLRLISEISTAEAVTGRAMATGRQVYWSLPSSGDTSGMVDCSVGIDGSFPDDFVVKWAYLRMEDTTLRVSADGDYTLDDDPYAAHFHQRFRESFACHPHELCAQALFERLSRNTVTPLVALRSATTGELLAA